MCCSPSLAVLREVERERESGGWSTRLQGRRHMASQSPLSKPRRYKLWSLWVKVEAVARVGYLEMVCSQSEPSLVKERNGILPAPPLLSHILLLCAPPVCAALFICTQCSFRRTLDAVFWVLGASHNLTLGALCCSSYLCVFTMLAKLA